MNSATTWAALLLLLPTLSAQSVADAVGAGHSVGREAAGVEAVRAALAAGSKVNERDRNGWTPLMQAALECRPAIAQVLLDAGAKVNLQASRRRQTDFVDHGHTPLTLAAACFIAHRRVQVATQRGLSTSDIESERAAPLALVGLLLRAGARINARDAAGRSPLMLAAMHDWPEVVEALLTAHADVRTQDRDGRRLLDYARHPAIIQSLQRAAAPPATGRSGRTVCDAQIALSALGYDVGPVDCIAGKSLAAVITKFQREHALPPTETLDPATLTALGVR
jgi:hypothetical protein